VDTELAMRACLVDPDLRQSNWQLSRCGSMKERNHFPMIDSNSLAMVGRSDIGLRSLQMDVDVGIDDTAFGRPYYSRTGCVGMGICHTAVFKLGSADQRGSATGSHGVRERIPKSSNCLHGF